MTVRAAGGVVWRAVEDGDIEVLVVHRPRYDDWTFPKGKADPGESDEDCALREVTEETGLSCDLGPYLTGVGYTDRLGRGKTARYWAMRPVGGAFEPNREVDEVRWLRPDDAARLLTYERDLPVLLAFRSLH